jgi:peptidoglycan/xylan/chitin deacetylase (PgdA/CDA1 family)
MAAGLNQRLRLVVLWCTRAVGGFALARVLTRNAVMIVGWHGVSVEREHERFPSLFISPESMRRRLAFLRRHYTVIDLDEVARQHAVGEFKPRQVVLTFDDGFENFRTAAVPLLREHSMTATNYIVSEYLDTRLPNYRMMVRDLVRLAARRERALTLPGGASVAAGAGFVVLENAALQEYDALERSTAAQADYVTALARTLGADVAALLDGRVWHCMTPETVRELAGNGFAMQLHTHSHYNVVDYADQAGEQVRVCRDAVEGTTGRPAPHFCYPSGRWTKSIWPTLEREGVRTATTTRMGPNFPETPLLALRRLMNGEDRSQLEFEFEVSNVRWLLAQLTGEADRATPSEKSRAYRETGGNL